MTSDSCLLAEVEITGGPVAETMSMPHLHHESVRQDEEDQEQTEGSGEGPFREMMIIPASPASANAVATIDIEGAEAKAHFAGKFLLCDAGNRYGDHCVHFDDVLDAARRVEGLGVVRTPVFQSQSLNAMCGGRSLFFKVEAFQKTGSFKLRGALNAVGCLLERRERELQGHLQQREGEVEKSNTDAPLHVVAHSSGNHAQALAMAARLYSDRMRRRRRSDHPDSSSSRIDAVEAHVAMTCGTPLVKREAVAAFGGHVTVTSENTNRARRDACRELLESYAPHSVEVSSSQNPHVIAGQGTVCLEFVEQLLDLEEGGGVEPDVVIIPAGGGGLASGSAVTLRAMLGDRARIVLAQPAKLGGNAQLSLRLGKLLELFPRRLNP